MNPSQGNIAKCLLLLAAALASVSLAAGTEDLSELNITQLETKLASIDAELKQISQYSLRSGIGAIGHRSDGHRTSDAREWIEIDLGAETPIDEIVLVPTIWRHTNEGFRADAFPAEFKIYAGNEGDSDGTLIADSKKLSISHPGIAPLHVETPGASGSWIRIEATELSQRAFDGLYVFQLAEILVFNGQENVALKRPLKTSSKVYDLARAWDSSFVVDGFLPYLMDAAIGEKSLAYVSALGTSPTLVIDLGAPYPINRIHLHAVDQSDTVPQAYAGDLGIPNQLTVEGALNPDFSDARLLLEYKQRGINDTGPIIMRNVPVQLCRYIRLVPENKASAFEPGSDKFRVGFAEIELFSEGVNVALNKEASSIPPSTPSNSIRSLAALTDGNNLYGKVLPIRDWLVELSRRHALETERPLVVAELNQRYGKQKKILERTSWLAIALAVGIAFTILFDRNLRMRQASRMRQRFAADLHDELGANLHAIGLLCDLAIESVDSREELIELLERTRVFTERSGMAARYCTNMLEARGICEDLLDEMDRTSRRLLADLDHSFEIEGEETLETLSPRKRIDLFLFYKESLTNIIRHSGAKRVHTHLKASKRSVQLSITDDGIGIPDTIPNRVPPSLKRRARLLHAQVSTDCPASGGTKITLKVKRRRFRIFK
ncbi:hypothetical protein [Pelagicoccus sp. SDUM812005]|uniref:hypothetical protein n=1 Tax=Pelagicoccus sp. SDUM812005 TaxID=3041257 RepID=UPI00280F070A|nr:hypothetical protein [Pelagicoccus sp. SDUM812005]MDQ8183564.1 histidine kinase [Pelagicoccus sp. SDUM812005]